MGPARVLLLATCSGETTVWMMRPCLVTIAVLLAMNPARGAQRVERAGTEFQLPSDWKVAQQFGGFSATSPDGELTMVIGGHDVADERAAQSGIRAGPVIPMFQPTLLGSPRRGTNAVGAYWAASFTLRTEFGDELYVEYALIIHRAGGYMVSVKAPPGRGGQARAVMKQVLSTIRLTPAQLAYLERSERERKAAEEQREAARRATAARVEQMRVALTGAVPGHYSASSGDYWLCDNGRYLVARGSAPVNEAGPPPSDRAGERGRWEVRAEPAGLLVVLTASGKQPYRMRVEVTPTEGKPAALAIVGDARYERSGENGCRDGM